MRNSMKTWHIEGAAVAVVLALTVFLTGNHPSEWLGALAVQLTFHHAAIAERMTERQAALTNPDVACYRWSSRLFIGKEALWFGYFAWRGAYSALVGVVLFLIYPLWRRYWRSLHPLALVPSLASAVPGGIES